MWLLLHSSENSHLIRESPRGFRPCMQPDVQTPIFWHQGLAYGLGTRAQGPGLSLPSSSPDLTKLDSAQRHSSLKCPLTGWGCSPSPKGLLHPTPIKERAWPCCR